MFFVRIRGQGRSRAISISNTKKITAKRKNRRENGMRAVFFGSNPHSKGLNFSRFRFDRAASSLAKNNKIRERKMASAELKRNKTIYQK